MEPVSGTTKARSETAEQRKITLGLLPGLDENGHDGATPRYKTIQRMAQEAEDAGLDTFWVADHFFYEEAPDKPRVGQWEAFTFLSALAAATSRIQLGPMVAATSFRNPALLAKMADSLDEISDGRFILGIGQAGTSQSTTPSAILSIIAWRALRRRCKSSSRCCARERWTSQGNITRRGTARSARAGRHRLVPKSSSARASHVCCIWSRATPTPGTRPGT